MKLSPLDIQHQEFANQPLGYQRKQVRDYLEQVSQAFAAQLAEISHLKQEILKQAEEIERLKLETFSLEKDRTLFEDYRMSEVEIVQKELHGLRQKAEQDIQISKQQAATKIAKEKAHVQEELRKMRDDSLHTLRSERESLSQHISLLRQMRSRAVRHTQTIIDQSQMLIGYIEDTDSHPLDIPEELRDYLEIQANTLAARPQQKPKRETVKQANPQQRANQDNPEAPLNEFLTIEAVDEFLKADAVVDLLEEK